MQTITASDTTAPTTDDPTAGRVAETPTRRPEASG
jgi:hypothetical protein